MVNNAASEVVQSGNLISASLNHAVVDASKAQSFTNKGQIKAASATGDAMLFDDAVNTTVLNDSGAKIQGIVAEWGIIHLPIKAVLPEPSVQKMATTHCYL